MVHFNESSLGKDMDAMWYKADEALNDQVDSQARLVRNNKSAWHAQLRR